MGNEKQTKNVGQSKWTLIISLGIVATLVVFYFSVPDVKNFSNSNLHK
jgi:hypothetical protein